MTQNEKIRPNIPFAIVNTIQKVHEHRRIAVVIYAVLAVITFIWMLQYQQPQFILVIWIVLIAAYFITRYLRDRVNKAHKRVLSGAKAATSGNVKALEKNATSESVEVRRGIAGNPNTPSDVLFTLLSDEDELVAQLAADNSNLALEDIQKFVSEIRSEDDAFVKSDALDVLRKRKDLDDATESQIYDLLYNYKLIDAED